MIYSENSKDDLRKHIFEKKKNSHQIIGGMCS